MASFSSVADTFRLVAVIYAGLGLVGMLGWCGLFWDQRRAPAVGELMQLVAGSAPLWFATAVALAASFMTRLDRRLAAVLVVATFWAAVVAQQALWTPVVIPYLSKLT